MMKNISLNVISPDVTLPNVLQYPTTTINQNKGEFISFTADDMSPYNFELYINTELAFNRVWQSDIQVDIETDTLNLSLGSNKMDLNIYDLSGNKYFYTWTLNLLDIDKPTMLTSPKNGTTLEEHLLSESNAPIWEAYDLNPGTYQIIRSGIIIDEGIWFRGNNTFRFPITDLKKGNYNFKAIIKDSSGNTLYSSVNIDIIDVIAPNVFPIDSFIYEPLYVANWFEFFVFDNYLSSYQLFMNDSLIKSDSLTTVVVDLQNLKPGAYNFTLKAKDESNNIGQNSVIVYVADFTPPLVKRPSDLIISENETGNKLTWSIDELNPYNYSIYVNGDILESGLLTTKEISVSLDNLPIGVYEYVFIVHDITGLSHTVKSYVTVVDITKPSITHLADCRYVVGDSNAILDWKTQELHPKSYKIYRNNEILIEKSWNGGDIILPLSSWSIGDHNILLVVTDTSGNSVTDNVLVKIVQEESITFYTTGVLSTSPANFVFFMLSMLVLSILFVLRRKRRF